MEIVILNVKRIIMTQFFFFLLKLMVNSIEKDH